MLGVACVLFDVYLCGGWVGVFVLVRILVLLAGLGVDGGRCNTGVLMRTKERMMRRRPDRMHESLLELGCCRIRPFFESLFAEGA